MPKLNQIDDASSAEDTVFDNLGLDREQLENGQDQDDELGDEQEVETPDDSDDDAEPEQETRESRVTQTEQRRQRPLPRTAEVKPDKHGNLVDANGRIVARAGAQARFYQGMHRAKQEALASRQREQQSIQRLQQTAKLLQDMQTELDDYRTKAEGLKQFNFTPEDQLHAMQLLSEMRKDTAGTLRKLLTRAAANGITIEGLQQNAGVDPKSLAEVMREEIAKAVGPIQQRNETEAKQAREREAQAAREQEALQEAQNFLTENPEARQYLPVIQQVIQRYPRMSLGEIWARIQLNLATRQRHPNSRKRSMPSGRGAPQGRASKMAPVNESYDSIVRSVLDEAGIV
jgi:hypothetical protein